MNYDDEPPLSPRRDRRSGRFVLRGHAQAMVLRRAVTLLVLLLAPACAAPEAPASEAQCPSGCSGNGECINGVCLCMSTHTGADCATEVKPPCTRSLPAVRIHRTPSKRKTMHLLRASQQGGEADRCCSQQMHA